ncbi:hypothetical protein EDD98_4819 [Streptomyces sp. PanSC19]|nr:hypothetical protein EDD98_4819 [Streptomyces sp. PanSC19]
MKIHVYGYRGVRHWRYRAVCPCGWSLDTHAAAIPLLPLSIRDHRRACRKHTCTSVGTRPTTEGRSAGTASIRGG